MNAQEYIARLEAEIAEKERKEREELLLSLGICDVKEEIPEDGGKSMNTYAAAAKGYRMRRLSDGTVQYYKSVKVPVEVSDEEYAQIQALLAKKAALETNIAPAQTEDVEPPFQVEMRTDSNNSSAAVFFKVIAWVLWIGGAVLALMTSFIGGEFSLATFLTTALTYLLYGGAAMCASELLENVAAIRNALTSIRFRKK